VTIGSEIISTLLDSPGKRGLAIARAYDGTTRSHTNFHLNCMKVPQDRIVRHRKGEPTLATLEKRASAILRTELK